MTDRSPPVNRPALNSVPAVLSMVFTAPDPRTRKAPLIVPVPVMAKDNAAESDLLPADAADHTAVLRGAV